MNIDLGQSLKEAFGEDQETRWTSGIWQGILLGCLLALIGTLLLSHAVSGQTNTKEYLSEDSWFHPGGGSALMVRRYAVPNAYIETVPEAAQERAQTALKANSWHRLSQLEAEQLGIRMAFPKASNRALYLLRGVVLNELTGSFEVFENNRRVLVHHGSLGRRPVPMRRKAIVALLRSEPEEVYISCSLSE
jgi:hypothetical protein